MSWTLPVKTPFMEEQMNHEPTRAYAEEIYKTCQELEYKRALEIGCAWGVSTLSILLANPKAHLTSVDVNPKTQAPNEIMHAHLPMRWKFVESDSASFWEQNTEAFDLIYVDGSHIYKDVVNDVFRAWEWLNPGGWLLIDDFNHKSNVAFDPDAREAIYGVSLACWQLVQQKKIKTVYAGPRVLRFNRKDGS